MSLVPFEQLFAQAATVAAIDIGAKDAADKYARAQVALQVAAGFKTLSTGDVAGAAAQVESALLKKVSDPGQAALVQGLFTAGMPFVLAAAQGGSALPLVSATVQGAAVSVAAGITLTANLYPAPAAAAAA